MKTATRNVPRGGSSSHARLRRPPSSGGRPPLRGRPPGTNPGEKRGVARFLCAILVLCLFFPSRTAADDRDKALPRILAAAESFFRAMKHRDYPAVWEKTTESTKTSIVDDTFRAIERGSGNPVPKEEIRRDFDASGPIARRYWEGFLERFDPDLPLERSRWEMGRIDASRAEILITGKTASMPARLSLFFEDGGWKVGLAESFRGRKE